MLDGGRFLRHLERGRYAADLLVTPEQCSSLLTTCPDQMGVYLVTALDKHQAEAGEQR